VLGPKDDRRGFLGWGVSLKGAPMVVESIKRKVFLGG